MNMNPEALHRELERLHDVVGTLKSKLEQYKSDNTAAEYQQQLVKTLTEDTDEMIFIADDEYSIQYINNAAARLSLKSVDAIAGQQLAKVFHGKLHTMLQRGINESLRSEKQLCIEESITLNENETWLNTLFVPIVNSNDPTVRVMVIARDVTGKRSGEQKAQHACENLQKLFDEKVLELQRTTQALQEAIADRIRAEDDEYKASERYRALVSNIPGAVYRCANDKYWTMEFISTPIEEICGYSAEEFVDNATRTFASIIVSEDVIPVAEAVDQGIQNKVPYEMHYHIKHKNGSIRKVYEKGRGIFSKEGEVLWLEGVIFHFTQ
jgi:PAS domain S-box-containing protein